MNLLGYDPEDFDEADIALAVRRELARLKKANLTFDDLLEQAAMMTVGCMYFQSILNQSERLLEDYASELQTAASKMHQARGEVARMLDEMNREYHDKAAGLILKGLSLAGKAQAIRGAKAKLANDPKQKEKKFIRDCWNGWRNDPSRYRSKAAFARDMLGKCEHVTSQKKIEDWCRDWEKEIGTDPA